MSDPIPNDCVTTDCADDADKEGKRKSVKSVVETEIFVELLPVVAVLGFPPPFIRVIRVIRG